MARRAGEARERGSRNYIKDVCTDARESKCARKEINAEGEGSLAKGGTNKSWKGNTHGAGQQGRGRETDGRIDRGWLKTFQKEDFKHGSMRGC